MTFEEMQLIMQSVVISQREMQSEFSTTQRELARFSATQREIQAEFSATQREMQATFSATQREMQTALTETQQLAQSIARGVQAMQDKALSDELKRDEERAEHQAQMAELRRISQGLVNMLDSIDSDRPTILRKLNTIENKTDAIIERLSQDDPH